MKWRKNITAALAVLGCSGVLPVPAQQNADDAGPFYTSYAVNDFSKETVELENTPYFDLFGQKLTDGYHIYSIQTMFDDYRRGGLDSLHHISDEYRSSKFFANFNNLCIARDDIGGSKSALMLGEMIQTQFTPLTMNKMHFSGLRLDMLNNGYAFTTLMSRTRPGRMAVQSMGGENTASTHSYVTYPLVYDQDAKERWSIEDGIDDGSSKAANKTDWSARTMFGDYDMFYGFHGEKSFGEHLNAGVTFMNHHRNDIRNGESWVGELPEEFVPEEIHFEIYDMTPDNMNDAGARLDRLRMTVNGNIDAGGPAAVYTIDDSTNVLAEGAMSLIGQPIMGRHPLICTFYPGTFASTVEKVEFDIGVAGNYLVFVSTEKMTPLYRHWGVIEYNREGQSVFGPIQYTIKDIAGMSIYESGQSGPQFAFATGKEKKRSEVYFGDYIARAPRVMGANDYSNATTYNYEYRLMLASMTGSVNLNGTVYETGYNAEFAYNAKRYAYPGPTGEVSYDHYMAAYLQLDRDHLAADGWLQQVAGALDLYKIDAGYEPHLPHYQVSRSLAWVNNFWLNKDSWLGGSYAPHYNDYPIQLSNNWSTVDDNDDDDFFVETERQPYPSDLSGNLHTKFYADGSMKSNPEANWGGITGHMRLPTGFDVVYDDNDGVIAERYDRNRDGELDYRQDFLLFDSDPPLLSLDADRNNNKIVDVEEDDMYPDLPYELGHVYTSNGSRSLGIMGGRCVFTSSPLPNTRLELGGVFEQVQDPDMDGRGGSEAETGGEGRNVSFYSFSTYRKQDRETGLVFFAGEELKKVNDGIRNDVVRGVHNDSLNRMEYRMQPDMLQLKNAFVSNTALGVEYRGIPNLMAASRMFYGYEQHFASDSIHITRALNDTVFRQLRVPYEDKSLNSFIFLIKAAYTLQPKFEFSGPAAALNTLNRLRVTPQYKFMYERYGSGDPDPRQDESVLAGYSAADSAQSEIEWIAYRDNNAELMFSVPILRLSYQLGAKTFIEGGWQWKRVQNFALPEESHMKRVSVLQLRNQATYQGYAITILMGLSAFDMEYDSNNRNGLYKYGSDYNYRNNEVFFKIYAGYN